MKICSRNENPNIMLSVIIPVYNVADYIKQSLNSVISSPIDNLEVIIIDDGSQDSTLEIVKEWFDKNVIEGCLLSTQNQGAGKARNLGIDYARGKYITFMDGDDICIPSSYKEALSCLEKFNLDLIMLRPQSFNHNSLISFPFPNTNIFDEILGDKKFKMLNLDLEPKIAKLEVSPVVKIINKSFWLFNGLNFSEGLYFEDVYPHIKIMLLNPKVGLLNYLVFKYRVGRDGQITSTFGERRKDFISILRITINEVIKYPISDARGECILAVLIRMGMWCAENINYNERLNFLKDFSFYINKLPRSWIVGYETSSHSSDWEKAICFALSNEDINCLLSISEGDFDYFVLKNHHSSNKDMIVFEGTESPNSFGGFFDKFSLFSFVKKLIKKSILIIRHYVLRVFSLIKSGY